MARLDNFISYKITLENYSLRTNRINNSKMLTNMIFLK